MDQLYSGLRSFEGHFKCSCCVNVQAFCDVCSFQVECPYLTVFSQQLSSDPEVVRIHQKPPLPFSLYISDTNDTASTYTLGMTLIGIAVNYINDFKSALESMIDACLNTVQNGEIISLRFYALDYQNTRYEISHSKSSIASLVFLSAENVLSTAINSSHAILIFKSPLRLLGNGSILHHFDFATFFRSQLRRCSSMFAYYGKGELNLDFVLLSKSAEMVSLLEDDIKYIQPSWSKSRNCSGLTGSAAFIGLVENMYPLLLLGSYFNAGKGAAYGSGNYQIDFTDANFLWTRV
jgi:hypothetical protein